MRECFNGSMRCHEIVTGHKEHMAQPNYETTPDGSDMQGGKDHDLLSES